MFNRTITKLSLDVLEAAARGVIGARDVMRDENVVLYRFFDKDGDRIGVVIVPVSETRARAMMMITIPREFLVTAMIVSAVYNSNGNSHGTFAFAQVDGDGDTLAVLEADMTASGGILVDNVRAQLQTLTDRINKFETCMLEGMLELGPDSEFLKGDMWTNVGTLLGGFLKGFTASNFVNA